MGQKRNSTKDRRLCFEAHAKIDHLNRTYMLCHLCKVAIYPDREEWEADHVGKLHVYGGSECWPAHVECHKAKTKTDNREVKKHTRIREKRMGIRKSKSRPMPGSKKSKWKRTFGGRTILRDGG